MSENKAHKMIRDEFEPTFTLKNLKKDLEIIYCSGKGLWRCTANG